MRAQWTVRMLALAVILTVMPVSSLAKPADHVDPTTIRNLVLAGHFKKASEELATLENRYFAGARKRGSEGPSPGSAASVTPVSDRVIEYAYSAFASAHPKLAGKLDAWVERSPDSYRAHMARAVYYVDRGFLLRGAKTIDKTSEAQLKRMQAAFEKANADLDRVLELEPAMTLAYAKKLSLIMAAGDAGRAREIAAKRLEHDPGSYAVFEFLLRALQPKWGGSMSATRRVVAGLRQEVDDVPALKPLLGYADYVRGDQFYLAGDYKAAVQAFNTALEYGVDTTYLRRRALAYAQLGEYAKAEADMRRALEWRPKSVGSRTRLANQLRYQERYKEAISEYDKALAISPREPEALKGRAHAYAALGKTQKARKDWLKFQRYPR